MSKNKTNHCTIYFKWINCIICGLYLNEAIILFNFFKWKRRNLRGKREILGTLNDEISKVSQEGKGRQEPCLHVLGCMMLSSTFSHSPQANCIPRARRITEISRPIFQTKNRDVKQPVQGHTTRRLEMWTSQRLFSLCCSVKESETLSVLKFEGREQVQGQEQSEVVKGTSWEEVHASSERTGK